VNFPFGCGSFLNFLLSGKFGEALIMHEVL